MNIREALHAVINESPNPYGKTYARAALELGGSEDAVVVTSKNVIGICHKKTEKQMVGEELRVQLLYVISNLAYWRGERAREVKAVLKAATKNLNFER